MALGVVEVPTISRSPLTSTAAWPQQTSTGQPDTRPQLPFYIHDDHDDHDDDHDDYDDDHDDHDDDHDDLEDRSMNTNWPSSVQVMMTMMTMMMTMMAMKTNIRGAHFTRFPLSAPKTTRWLVRQWMGTCSGTWLAGCFERWFFGYMFSWENSRWLNLVRQYFVQ